MKTRAQLDREYWLWLTDPKNAPDAETLEILNQFAYDTTK